MAHNHHTDRWVKLKWLCHNKKLWEGWQHPGDPRRRLIVRKMARSQFVEQVYLLERCQPEQSNSGLQGIHTKGTNQR